MAELNPLARSQIDAILAAAEEEEQYTLAFTVSLFIAVIVAFGYLVYYFA